MKRKFFFLGLLLIVSFNLYLATEYSSAYTTPEEALVNHKSSEHSLKQIVSVIWLKDEPVIFFISNSGRFCAAEYLRKSFMGKTGWRITSVGSLVSTLHEIDPKEVVPTPATAKNQTSNGKSDVVLYGVTKSLIADRIKVNGKTPTFKNFEFEGQNYTFWYIIGSSELESQHTNISYN